MLTQFKNRVYRPEDPILRVAIPGFNSLYQITTKGTVYKTFNARTGSSELREIKQYVRPDGYVSVNLYDPNRDKNVNRLVHRLVCSTFKPEYIPPMGSMPVEQFYLQELKTDVHHIDHNKENNNVWNLMWVTKTENARLRAEYDRQIKESKLPSEADLFDIQFQHDLVR